MLATEAKQAASGSKGSKAVESEEEEGLEGFELSCRLGFVLLIRWDPTSWQFDRTLEWKKLQTQQERTTRSRDTGQQEDRSAAVGLLWFAVLRVSRGNTNFGLHS